MKKMILTSLLPVGIFIFLIFLSMPVLAGNGTISGQIVQVGNNRSIPAVSVTIEGTNIGTISDFYGHFFLADLRPGKYNLIFSHKDYQTEKRVDVEVVAGQETTLSVSLTPLEIGLNEKDIKNKLKNQGLSEGTVREEKAGVAKQRTPAAQEEPSTLKDSYTFDNYKNDNGIIARPHIDKIPPLPDYEFTPQPYDMFFRDYGTNGFVQTEDDRLSTFAVDVDDASYVLARRYLQEGYLPPTEAIRVEEFINHFDYGYKNPDGKKFRVFTEWAASPFSPRTTLLKIGIKGSEIFKKERRPLNLTLVVDVSGSMGYDNRMDLVRESLRLLVNQLDSRDMVGMVVYGSTAREVLEPVSAARRQLIFRAIERLSPGGSTYAEAGIRLGYKMADRQYVDGHNNCVILLSDGVANVGRTSPEDIMKRVKEYTKKGITLSAFGFGMGNYNDYLMEQLAQQGNGKYAYVNDRDEARIVFVKDFVGNFQILARDVKIQVTFDHRLVVAYRLLGYENREVPDHRFSDNRQDGGEIGAGHQVTAIYELVLADKRTRGIPGTIAIRWKDPDQTEVTELTRDIELSGKPQNFNQSRPEFRLAVTAAEFAELLKGSIYSEEVTFRNLYRLVQRLEEEMPGEQTRELAELIKLDGNLNEGFSRR
ncbi:MAG: von Willebrand factor type A domain-containing protein [candidate division Zixibacteria bacterium]|nr:von Willebrand factor type A domain-containing protein [candidate division Zixibacteria bacterium]